MCAFEAWYGMRLNTLQFTANEKYSQIITNVLIKHFSFFSYSKMLKLLYERETLTFVNLFYFIYCV